MEFTKPTYLHFSLLWVFPWFLFQLICIFCKGNETTTQLPSNDFTECFYGDYILDHFDNGICNDVLNTPKCLFDGGDCCDGNTNDNSTCLTCFCFEESSTFGKKYLFYPFFLSPKMWQQYKIVWKYQNVSDSCTGFPDFVGDGFCDDQNNNYFCFFDGGDCCFNVTTDFCSECNCFQGIDEIFL